MKPRLMKPDQAWTHVRFLLCLSEFCCARDRDSSAALCRLDIRRVAQSSSTGPAGGPASAGPVALKVTSCYILPF